MKRPAAMSRRAITFSAKIVTQTPPDLVTSKPCSSIGSSLRSSQSRIQQSGGSLSPREESEPPSKLGRDSDRRLHIWVNVAVIGKRSRRCEGEHEGLILGEIARRIECSVIACHCMWGITHVGPHNLRSRLDRQCCRIKHIHIIFLDDLHLGHRGSCAGCSCSGWTWRRLRCSCRRGSRCCPPTPPCSQKQGSDEREREESPQQSSSSG